jgi:hypothetical protein
MLPKAIPIPVSSSIELDVDFKERQMIAPGTLVAIMYAVDIADSLSDRPHTDWIETDRKPKSEMYASKRVWF